VSFEHEDRFGALERGYEEHQRAAQDLAGMLGLSGAGEPEAAPTAEPTAEDKPRDEQGRFIVGKADAGEKGEPVVVKPSMGHMIMAHIDNDDSYLQ